MLGTWSDLTLERPKTLSAALKMLADQAPDDAVRPFAGGTDLMVLMNAGVLKGRRFVDVQRLPELQRFEVGRGGAVIGAAVSYRDLLADKALCKRWPNLAEASRWVGGTQIQARGTLGGNIVNASPAADAVPALIAYNATLVVASARGERRVELSRFYSGYKQMDLAPDELVVAIELPNAPARAQHYFRKVGTRLAQAISKVMLAGVTRRGTDGKFDHVALSMGSVAPYTLRLWGVEEAVAGRKPTPKVLDAAEAALDAEIAPIDDIRSNADYRRFAARGLLRQCLADGEHTALSDLPVPF